jgi:hypothetical protein
MLYWSSLQNTWPNWLEDSLPTHLAVLCLMCLQQVHHVPMALVPQRLAQEVDPLQRISKWQ